MRALFATMLLWGTSLNFVVAVVQLDSVIRIPDLRTDVVDNVRRPPGSMIEALTTTPRLAEQTCLSSAHVDAFVTHAPMRRKGHPRTHPHQERLRSAIPE